MSSSDRDYTPSDSAVLDWDESANEADDQETNGDDEAFPPPPPEHDSQSSGGSEPLARNRFRRALQRRAAQPREEREPLDAIFSDSQRPSQEEEEEEEVQITPAQLASAVCDLAQPIDFSAIATDYPGWEDSEWLREMRYKGYRGIIDKCWDEMISAHRSISSTIDKRFFMSITLKILMSTSPKLLINLMLGTLHRVIETDPQLAVIHQLNSLCTSNQKLPCIYWQTIVHNDDKRSLTWNELEALLGNIERYITDNAYAYKVDKTFNGRRLKERAWPQAMSNAGKRWYLASNRTKKQGGSYKVSRAHVAKVRKFVQFTRARLAKIPSSRRHEESIPPVSEFGWTIEPSKRFYSHQIHSNSNTILNLVEAILMAEETGFSAHRYIICVPWEPAQGILAEPLFTQIGHGYVEFGGCNTFEAGLNNRVHLVNENQWVELKEQIVQVGTPFRANLQAEIDRSTAYIEEMRALDEEEKQLDAQIALMKQKRSTASIAARRIETTLDNLIERSEAANAILRGDADQLP
jgi:hypothetical protein